MGRRGQREREREQSFFFNRQNVRLDSAGVPRKERERNGKERRDGES